MLPPDSASQWRETRAGSVRRVLSHFQPRLLTALKPSSIQKRRAYQLGPASSGGSVVVQRFRPLN